MLISDEYRRLNTELHARHGGYGSKGKAWADRLCDYADKWDIVSILDYGCGKGSLKPALNSLLPVLDIREYDPAVPGKDLPPEPADLVVCTDVLEHVEPECLDDVLADLVRLGNKAVLVAVACRPGKRVLEDGRPDHLIVQPPKWWMKRLAPFGRWQTLRSLRNLEHVAVLHK